MEILSGIIPPSTTPFDQQGQIVFTDAAEQIRWLIEQGASGVAVGGSTGEGHTLETPEFTELINTAVVAADNQVPVIAGIITDSTHQAIERGKALEHLDIAALQVTPVHYLFRPDDDAMVEHFRSIADETGRKVIIYNVVPWTYLSPELLIRIMQEVPNVIGVKQSAGDLKLFADLMLNIDRDMLIFSAVDALMYPSYTLGAHGSIAAILAAAPKPSVALWKAVKACDHATALALHQKLLHLWNALLPHDNLPAATKYAQILQGCPAGYPRQPMSVASDTQRVAIEHALKDLGCV
ncbi:MAG: dihydrodipicolinate synthase family protein [Granulosicoccus sp.]|nr:dihydrodipicolinate synthase family protein [Granulosicoccus sp.]